MLALIMAFALCTTAFADDVLILGTSADYAPFEFMYPNEDGEMVYGGIDIFVAEYLAEATGKELKVENMAFDYLLAALQKGDYDIVIAAMEETEERLNAADFSDPYYTDYPAMILVKAEKAEELATLADFDGLYVAAQTGTTKLDIVTNDMPGANVVPLQNVNDIINQLINDKIDAAVLDGGVALEFAEAEASLAVAAASDELGAAAPFCVAVQKGDPKGLLPGINEAIAQMSIIHSTPFNFGHDKSQSIVGVEMASAYVGNIVMPPLFGIIAQYLSIALMPFYLGAILVLMFFMHRGMLIKCKK